MGTLAFDADRLVLLAAALTDAAELLAATRCWDPEGAAALAVAADARTALDGWAAKVLQIAGCGALSEYRPIAVDPAELYVALGYVLAHGYGWTTTLDPLGYEWQIPLAEHAAALGVVLTNHGAPLGSTSEEHLLLTQLQAVIADPAALAALRANLSPAGAAALADRLAMHRADLVAAGGGPPGSGLDTDPALATRVTMVDGIAGALATVLVDPTAPLAGAQGALGAMRPYAAALVISQLDAPDETVVALAESTMRRYYELRNDPQQWPRSTELPDAWSLGIGDLLFPRVAAVEPALANRFVVTIGTMSQELLTHTVREPANAAAVLATASDPVVGVAAARNVIVPLITHLLDPGPYPNVPSSVMNIANAVSGLRAHLGTLIAPWMVQFLDEHPAFGWSDVERDHVMRFVLDDDQAFADVLALSGRWADSLPLPDLHGDPAQLQPQLDRAARVMGELLGLLEERRIDDAFAAQAQWDLVVSLVPRLVGKGVQYAGISGVPAKVVIRVANEGIEAGSDLIQEHGWLGSPPPLAEVLHGIRVDADVAMAMGSYLSIVTMRALLVERGDLPADAPDAPTPWDEAGCPSADYRAALDQWLSHIDDGHARDRLDLASRAFTAPGQSELECQRLQND